MLRELFIRDFGIIDNLHITFAPGLNVLTGETGAGKSMLVDAVTAILGARAQPEWLRAGASRALVEGIFDLSPSVREHITAFLAEHGLEGDEDTLILSRELRANGRSLARINGRVVTAALLAEVGRLLVDIHGQGAHLSLLRPRAQLFLLDRFAHLEDLRAAVAEEVARLRAVRKEMEALRRNERELAQRADLLAYQIREIEEAQLEPGEEEALEAERRRLAHAVQLSEGIEQALQALEGDTGTLPGVIDLLGEVGTRLLRLSDLDASLGPLAQQAELLADQVNDLLRELAHYRDTLEFNPRRLEEVEERLALIRSLKRKYGDTVEDILAYAAQAAEELARIEHADERLAVLEAEEAALLENLGRLAADLSRQRHAAAQTLARAVEQELKDLRMEHTQFRVHITQEEDPRGIPVEGRRLAFDSTGIDRVEFLVSTNPGEPLRPLARVASGGETARLMLALKTVLAHADPVPTLIFDEIDVGIGGRLGSVVGRKLRQLAETHQVLCVTHLPQLAAHSTHHIHVRKEVAGERTVVRVRVLEGEERVRELAAMLGAPTQTGLQSAYELLQQARQGGKPPKTS